MPKAFDKCAKTGRVRTITKGPKKGHLVCFKDGKSFLGGKRSKGHNA